MSRNDERSIRANYYERVGFKGMNEKTLDNLLNEDPRSIEKLQQFCLRFSVPPIMRLDVWKVILEFSSVYSRNTSEILWWKEKPYHHIKEAERRMQKVTDGMTLPQEMAVQFFVRQGWIQFDLPSQLKEPSSLDFIAIATSMLKITDSDEVPSYYLSQELYKFLHSHSNRVMTDLEKSFHKKLSNIHPKLHSYCQKIDLLTNLPLDTWIHRAFAGVLAESALVTVWDKVIGGSMKVLVLVAVALMELLSRRIQQCTDWREALGLLSHLSEQESSLVAQKAIDQWIKEGYQLFACSDHGRKDKENAGPQPKTPLTHQRSIASSSSSCLPLMQLVNEIKIDSNASIFASEDRAD